MQTDHELLSALWIARALDSDGNLTVDISKTMRLALTKGHFTTSHLETGKNLLIAVGLLVEGHGFATPTDALTSIARLDDTEAIKLLRSIVRTSTASDDSRSTEPFLTWQQKNAERMRIGNLAEKCVEFELRSELVTVGRPDLAERVLRVSMISDSFGYDISTPVIGGNSRHLEVKGSTRETKHLFSFFISRNEYSVGLQDLNWALIGCAVVDDDVTTVGWCPASVLAPYLPEDQNGRWTEALVRLPKHLLISGLPSAVQ